MGYLRNSRGTAPETKSSMFSALSQNYALFLKMDIVLWGTLSEKKRINKGINISVDPTVLESLIKHAKYCFDQ